MGLCKVCKKNKATVPDRNYEGIGRLRFDVCEHCHAERIRNDVARIMEKERRQGLLRKGGLRCGRC